MIGLGSDKKKVFFEALISYRYLIVSRKNPHIVWISYQVKKSLSLSGDQDLPNTPVLSIDIGIGEHKNTLKHYNMAAEAAIKTKSLYNIFLGHHVLIFFGVFPKCVPQFPITILFNFS